MSDEAEPPEFRPAPLRSPLAFDVDEIKALIQKFFKVYEVESDTRGAGAEVAAFYVQADPAVFAERFEQVREAVRTLDPTLLVILQYKGGEDVILVARRPPVVHRGAALNLVLFILTVLTTTLAGSIFYSGYEQAENLLMYGDIDLSYLTPRYLALGFLSFSLPVMAILGIHELGHFFVAKRHHVRTSLPYFIPVPPIVPVGTFGAFISIREPIPDRKALFDIGAAGPIAGFIASIPVLVIGLLLTSAVAAPLPAEDEIVSELVAPDGTAWGYGHDNGGVVYVNETTTHKGERTYVERITANRTTPGFAAGTWHYRIHALQLKDSQKVSVRISFHTDSNYSVGPNDKFVSQDNSGRNFSYEIVSEEVKNQTAGIEETFALPTNASSVTAEFHWQMPPKNIMSLGTSLLFLGINYLIPTPDDVLIHPTGFAGWVGLLVTGFNLLPAGQLDGGHVARAVLGRNMKWASYASVLAMIGLSIHFSGWLVMAVLIIFLGLRHPPPLNDKTVLDPRRKFLAAVVLLILLVSFIPVPFFPPG